MQTSRSSSHLLCCSTSLWSIPQQEEAWTAHSMKLVYSRGDPLVARGRFEVELEGAGIMFAWKKVSSDRLSAPPPGILMSVQLSLACQRLSTRLQWSFGSLCHFRSSESCYSSSEYSGDGRSSGWSCPSSVLELCRGLRIRYERLVSWWARRV